MNKKELTKKEELTPEKIVDTILGGKIDVNHEDGTPQFIDKDYKAEIAKIDPTALIQDLTITDPLTGKTATYQLDRGGTRDQKLAMVLADPDASEERKMATASLWLFEKGKESSSFMLDLMASKGAFVKESRQFQSRMQYDWTYFIGMFASFLYDQATTILAAIIPGTPVEGIEHDAFEFMKKQKEEEKEPSLHDWAVERYHQIGNPEATAQEEKFAIMMLEIGVRFASEGHSMKQAMIDLTAEREKAMNKPYPNIPQ